MRKVLFVILSMTVGFGQLIDNFESDIGMWEDPNYSGSTTGLLDNSAFEVSSDYAFTGMQSGKLTLNDDPATTGGWFVRLNNRDDQVAPDSRVGFWLRASNVDSIRIVIWDNGAGGDGYEAGPWMVATPGENDWEYVEVDLANTQFVGWITGNGEINSTDFVTIESIQLKTDQDIDDVLYIDDVLETPVGSVNITGLLNMSTYPDGATDSTSAIDVRGSFNGWSAGDNMTFAYGDVWRGWYQLPVGDALEYKFTHTDDLDNLTWEGDPNRTYTVPSEDATVMHYWGPSDSPLTETDSVDVWFRVNMAGVAAYDGGQVDVRGSFNGWSAGSDLTQESNTDFWSGQISMGAGAQEYKFVWTGDDASTNWENVDNRTFTSAGDTTLAWVYFDNAPPTGATVDTFSVTFTCNTSVLDNMTDSTVAGFYVSGGFNGWSQNDTLANSGDYWSKTVDIVGTVEDGASFEYKYRYTSLAGSEYWEDNLPGGGNRAVTVMNDTVLPVQYFDDVAPFTPTDDIDVWFRVNMEAQYDFGYAGEPVDVRGSFNGWSAGSDLTQEGDGYYWSGLISMPDSAAGTLAEYKFVWTGTDGSTNWENIDNRSFTVGGDTTLAFKYWDNSPPSVIDPVTAYVYFTADMAAYEDIGIFSVVRNDTVQVRGGFNGWASSALPDGSDLNMTRIPGETIYELAAPILNYPDTEDNYKYFIQWSPESLDLLGAPYPNLDWNSDWGYEVPPAYGAGNRPFTFVGDPNEVQEIGLEYYMDLPLEGVLPEDHTIDLTFTVDMNNADLFDAATDTLWMYIKDPIAAHLWGYFPESTPFDDLVMHDDGLNGDATAGDGIFSLVIPYTGKAPYTMVYVYHFTGPTNELEEGGGFASGRFRCRYIHPTSVSEDGPVWPTSFAFPMDTWQLDPPLVVEETPDLFTVGTEPATVPYTFAVQQNYPNPFNPTTEIRFTLAEASDVTFTVFNVLGQEIVTYKNSFNGPGHYSLRWNGLNNFGSAVPSGVYFYEIKAGDNREIKKMTLLK